MMQCARTWYTSDKNAQLAHTVANLQAAEVRAVNAEKSKDQLEKTYQFYKDHVDDQAAQIETLKGRLSAAQSKADTLQQEVNVARKENAKLIDALKAQTQSAPGKAGQ